MNLIPIADLFESTRRSRKIGEYGSAMTIPMGIHGVGVSPSASGNLNGRGRYTFHIPVGKSGVVMGDPLAKPRRRRRRREK